MGGISAIRILLKCFCKDGNGSALSRKWGHFYIVTIKILISRVKYNKANMRDLIAAIGLVILLQLHSNFLVFRPYDLEIRWMNSRNNSNHQWIQTGVTVQKCSIRVKIGNFLFCVTLKFDGGPWKTKKDTFSMLFQALCIISWPVVNSKQDNSVLAH